MAESYWEGTLPEKCDFCVKGFGEHQSQFRMFIDGKTKLGPWGIMCPPCHLIHGVGLGEGRGQKYLHVPGGQLWMKVEG